MTTDLQIIGNGDTIEPGILGSHFSLITVTSNGQLQISDAFLDNANSSGPAARSRTSAAR